MYLTVVRFPLLTGTKTKVKVTTVAVAVAQKTGLATKEPAKQEDVNATAVRCSEIKWSRMQ